MLKLSPISTVVIGICRLIAHITQRRVTEGMEDFILFTD